MAFNISSVVSAFHDSREIGRAVDLDLHPNFVKREVVLFVESSFKLLMCGL